MKYKLFLIMLLVVIGLSACKGNSQSALQTAVSEAIMTSVAEAPAPSTNTSESGGSNLNTDQLKSELDAAQITLTQQASQLLELQATLDQANLLLTPSMTPTTEDTATPTITLTPTQIPSATASPTTDPLLLPEGQKFVVATRNAPLFYIKENNDAGFPVMVKTNPIVRYVEGDWIVVESAVIKADGGLLYYKVVRPFGSGYYVQIDHVRNM